MHGQRFDHLLTAALEHHQAGRLQQAEGLYRQVLAIQPNQPDALHAVGLLANQVGQYRVAVDLITCALSINPNVAEWHSNLGCALMGLGEFPKAIEAGREALRRDSKNPLAHNNLGYALQQVGQLELAITAYRAAIQFGPNYPDPYNNLGNTFQILGRLDEALEAYQSALRVKSDYWDAYNNLGGLHKSRGELEQALTSYRRAMELAPLNPIPHSNLIYTMHFSPRFDPQALFAAHQSWNERHARPFAAAIRSHANDRSPDRRLRVGYVSPHFREHAVGRFLLPLIEHHDNQKFEVICFSDVVVPDELTGRFRAAASAWHQIVGYSDEQVAQLVRQQRIDILVDLTMHMEYNRLPVFARKPAPVQVTYLAYCSTTGLDTIDYRLSDPYLDPPGTDGRQYSEQTIRLPQTYWCYQPATLMPDPGRLPAAQAGHITFGSLNNFCKVTDATLDIWCQLLRAVPDSRLILHTHPGSHRQRIKELLAGQQVDPQRLDFVGHTPLIDYAKLYQSIDIALDPFPYSGGTTTCDALWMGVPVVTLVGNTAVGRAGLSLLSNIGLPELIARTPEQYVQIATDLAGDLPRLSELRSTLRQRMERSPLMDAQAFAQDVERLYRQMWRNWLSTQTS